MGYDFEVITITDTDKNDGSNSTVRVGLKTASEDGSMKTYSSSNLDEGELRNTVVNDLLSTDDDVTNFKFSIDQDNAWSLNQSWVTSVSSGKSYYNEGGAYVSSSTPDVIPASRYLEQVKARGEDTNFTLIIKTSSDNNSGTNNSVYIKLFDTYGNASPLTHVNQPLNDWKTGATDTIELVVGVGLKGPITRILLHKPGTQGWKPESITVKPKVYSDDSTTFSVNEWLDGDTRWWFGKSS